MTATGRALTLLVAPVARLSRVAWLALALAGAALVLGVGAWLARLHWFDAPYWVLVAWTAAVLVAAGVAAAAFRQQRALGLAAVARHLESTGAWRRGSLTALLEPAAPGVSASLLDSADRGQASRLGDGGSAALGGLTAPVRRRAAASLLCAIAAVVVLGGAGPVRGTAAALWHPARAWAATTSPVRLRASAPLLDRGDSVTFSLDAIGRRHAVLWLRAPGEAWRAGPVALDSTGHATRVVGPLTGDLYARLTSGARASDTIVVRVRLPVFLGSLSVSAHYPAYLHLEDEPLPVGGDTIVVPAGTRLDTRGEATAALRQAEWHAGGVHAPLTVTGARFDGSMVPVASAAYELALVTAAGAPLGGDTVRLPIRVLPDSAPRIEIPVPGADTVAPADLRVPLVLDVRDDHGIASVTLESRRISAIGVADLVVREEIALPSGRPDRAILSWVLGLERRGLLPGDTLRYVAIARDNAPAAHVGRSREFVVRLPTLTELRTAQREASSAVAARLDSIANRSAQLERRSEDLAREQPRPQPDASPASGENSLSFEQAKRAEAVAQAQQELMRDAESLKAALRELEERARAAGLTDPEWQKHLDEIRQELDRALTPELREKLAELQRSLKDLDAERTKEALTDLAAAQKQLKDALERSRELFKRAALEGDLVNLAQEAKELAQQQQQWNAESARADSTQAGATERELARRADSLAAALSRAGEQMGDSARAGRMDAASQAAQDAAREMQRAGQAAQQGQKSQAGQHGAKASASLQPLGAKIDQERQSMQGEWRQEVADALDRALSETTRLAERQLKVQQSFEQGGDPASSRGEQGAVEEGVQKLLDQMRQTSGKNALVSPQIGAALAAAQQEMERARDAVSSSAPNGREAGARAGAAVEALNAASYEMVRARGDVSSAQSGSGMAEAIEQMGKMAGQQGKLGQQAAGMLPMIGSSGMKSQLQQLGAQQRALGEQLERLRAQSNMPGAGALAAEAKDLARRLEAGRLDPQTVDRQERLFRRMLDAGRTLQGHEEDEKKERQSTTATGDSISLPPVLRARLTDAANRLRMPSWEQLQRFSPEERRLVVDYFRKLSEDHPQ